MNRTVGVRLAIAGLAGLAALAGMTTGCSSNSSSSSGNTTAAPTFSPGGGTYNTSKTVTIADTTAGAVLYCTTDGTTPTSSSPKCAQPTTIFQTQFLQAIAVAPGKEPSAVASAAYTIDLGAAATPTFSPAGGTYLSAQTVTIADATSGVNIYYTVDGSVPTASSTQYTAPIAVSTTETLSAIAVASGYTNSGIASAAYAIGQSVATPSFSPPSGNYTSTQTVAITDATPSAAIFYTVDGSAPSASSTAYSGAITVSATEVINAIAVLNGSSSAIGTAAYTISTGGSGGGSVPAPTLSPASGSTFAAGQTVTISDTDAAAAIYYTTDGGTPTASSTPYPASGFQLTTAGPVTVNAIAFDPAISPNGSAVGTAVYTVGPASVPTPTLSPASGTVAQGQVVTIADSDANAAIYYTTDGTTPTVSSTRYTSAGVSLQNVGSATIKAVAIDTGVSSPVATGSYTVTATSVVAPVISPATGSVVAIGQTVTITETDAKAKIYYTLNGSTPTASSTLYSSGGFTLTSAGSITVKTIAIDGSNQSAIVTATYAVAPASVPAPTFSPASGSTLASGQKVTLADTDTNASIYYTIDGSAPTASSTRYTAPFALVASGTVKAIAIDTGVDSTDASATYTVQAAQGPHVSGTVKSGTSAVSGAQVQLYTAGLLTGDAGYGSAGTALGAAVTTDASGAFSATYTACPASPHDLVYVVATGGNAGNGANPKLELMTALGPCGQLASGASYVVNEVTTVASAFALAPFMTTAPNVGSSTTNYLGLTHAFATVNNLVDVTTGMALSITPAYAAHPVAFLNSSTAPQARVNTLGNILNACVDSNGAGGGCSNLISAATPPNAGTAPTNTLQAILDIAQNPGHNVTALYGLATSAFAPDLSAAPNDFTLALTFTGGGLGIDPAVTNGTVTYAGTTFTGIGPSRNTALAVDASGNVWVTAGGYDYNLPSPVVPTIAEFSSQGAPLTPATTVITTGSHPPAVTYGGFNPEPPTEAILGPIALDGTGDIWVGDLTSAGDLIQITPSLQVPYAAVLGEEVLSSTIDANGVVWAFLSNSAVDTIQNQTITTLSVPTGAQVAQSATDLTFDANGGLWAVDSNATTSTTYDVYQLSTSNSSVLFDAYPSTGSASTTLAADNSGNIYGCGESGTLGVFNNGATVNSYPIVSSRGCGSQLLLDGNGHLFAVSNGFSFTPASTVDEFTLNGTAVSPANGYTGTSSEEPVVINPDTALQANLGVGYVSGTAAIDGSGNLWTLNPDTIGNGTPGNVLVEFVGIAAPVVTPASVALNGGTLGTRP